MYAYAFHHVLLRTGIKMDVVFEANWFQLSCDFRFSVIFKRKEINKISVRARSLAYKHGNAFCWIMEIFLRSTRSCFNVSPLSLGRCIGFLTAVSAYLMILWRISKLNYFEFRIIRLHLNNVLSQLDYVLFLLYLEHSSCWLSYTPRISELQMLRNLSNSKASNYFKHAIYDMIQCISYLMYLLLRWSSLDHGYVNQICMLSLSVANQY